MFYEPKIRKESLGKVRTKGTSTPWLRPNTCLLYEADMESSTGRQEPIGGPELGTLHCVFGLYLTDSRVSVPILGNH